MSVNLVQFPLQVSEWSKSVSYLTDIITGRNGQEVRNAIWQDPLHKFNATFSVKNYADMQTLVTFFHAMKGREGAFLVKDWADYKITTPIAPQETGNITSFQLIKRYTEPVLNTTYIRTIKFPKINSVAVTLASTNLPVGFTVSLSTGVVTLDDSYAASDIRFTCSEFYVPVRFDVDELPIEMLNHWLVNGADRSNIEIPEIPLIEVR